MASSWPTRVRRSNVRDQFLLTVVVPAHFSAGHIGRTLNSLLPIPFPVEVVVVENGSSELGDFRTSTLGRHRLVYFHRESADLSAARNLGLASASGKYVLFLDSDDEILPAQFASALLYLDGCDGDSLQFSSGEGSGQPEFPSTLKPFRGVIFESGRALAARRLVYNRYSANAGHRVVKRELLAQIFSGFQVGYLHEDHLYSFVVDLHSRISLDVLEPIHRRHRRSESLTATISRQTSADGYQRALLDINSLVRGLFGRLNFSQIWIWVILGRLRLNAAKKRDFPGQIGQVARALTLMNLRFLLFGFWVLALCSQPFGKKAQWVWIRARAHGSYRNPPVVAQTPLSSRTSSASCARFEPNPR